MVLEAIKNRWKDLGIAVRSGLDQAMIAGFETRHSVRLPAEMRAFYRFMDGMPDGSMDEAFISFWPLEQLAPVLERLSGCRGIPDYGGIESSLPEASSYFVFADHSIFLHVYAVRLSDDSSAPNPVLWIGGGDRWYHLVD